MVNILIKKLDGTKYDFNINEAEKISKLKQKLRINDELYRKNIVYLIYKEKVVNDDEYICSYGIKNDDFLVVLLRYKHE